jgi:two-component system alkaline phosphatase synthesis response regulator PhoP
MPAKILVVEDNPDARDFLGVVLRGEGYTVYTANDGEEGIKLVRADCPDLIVSDINMPNLDGIRMVKLLREMPECSKIPVLIMSAYGSGKLDEAIEAGANHAMRKPVEFGLFLKALKELLD